MRCSESQSSATSSALPAPRASQRICLGWCMLAACSRRICSCRTMQRTATTTPPTRRQQPPCAPGREVLAAPPDRFPWYDAEHDALPRVESGPSSSTKSMSGRGSSRIRWRHGSHYHSSSGHGSGGDASGGNGDDGDSGGDGDSPRAIQAIICATTLPAIPTMCATIHPTVPALAWVPPPRDLARVGCLGCDWRGARRLGLTISSGPI